MRSVAAVFLVLLAVPATANAVRIELRPGPVPGENELVYTAGPGEVNQPSLGRDGAQPGAMLWYVMDVPTLATARVPPCRAYMLREGGFGTTSATSTCPDDHVTSVVVD